MRFFDKQGAPISPDTFAPLPGATSPSWTDLAKAFDGNVDTKWCETGLKKGSFYFSFTIAVQIASYEWVTGDDRDYRDPVSWSLQGRNLNTATDAWTVLHSMVQAPVPTARKAVVGPFVHGSGTSVP